MGVGQLKREVEKQQMAWAVRKEPSREEEPAERQVCLLRGEQKVSSTR